MLASETARHMECLENLKKPQPILLEHHHKVWFSSDSIVKPKSSAPSVASGGQKASEESKFTELVVKHEIHNYASKRVSLGSSASDNIRTSYVKSLDNSKLLQNK